MQQHSKVQRLGINSITKKEQRGLITGMVLGDGCLKYSGINYNICFNHSIKQKDYFLWKIEQLQPMFHYDLQTAIRYRKVGKYKTCQFCSRVNSKLKTIGKLSYNPKKKITRKLLDHLTPKGIAIWYMDDGCLNRNNRTLMISTYCSYEENEICQKYFAEKHGIHFRISRHYDKYYLATGWKSESANKLKELVSQFIIPEMRYKIDDIAVATPPQFRRWCNDIVRHS